MTQSEVQANGTPELRDVKIGNITIKAYPASTSLALSMQIRLQRAQRSGNADRAATAVLKVFESALGTLVPDEDHIDAALDELAANRVDEWGFLEALVGAEEAEPANREERRAKEREDRREATVERVSGQQPPRRRRRGGRGR